MTSRTSTQSLFVVALFALVTMFGCARDDAANEAGSEAQSPAANNSPAMLDPDVPGGGTSLPMPAPDFQVATLNGEEFSLEGHQGNVIIVNFWATWCGPCIIEIPDLQQLHETYADRGLAVIGVSVEDGDENLVRDFMAEYGMTYPVAISMDLTEQFGGVYGLPTTFVIDKNGQIVERIIGLFPTEEMRPRLEELLDA